MVDLPVALTVPSEIFVGGMEDEFAEAVVDADFKMPDGLPEKLGNGEIVVEAAAIDRGDGVGEVKVGVAVLHLVGGLPVAWPLIGGHRVEAGLCYGNFLRCLAGIPEVIRHLRDSY